MTPATGGQATGGQATEVSERLADLFAREWEVRLERDPLFATSVGDPRYNDRLPDISPASLGAAAEQMREFLAELDAVESSAEGELSANDRVNALIFRRQLESRVASYDLGEWQIPINADSGFHMGFATLAADVPLQGVDDFEHYLARMRAWPRYVEQQIANMRIGLERGMTVPRVTLEGYEATITPHLVEDATRSAFWPPFAALPSTLQEGERERLRAAGESAVRDAVVPGYQALLEFLVDEYRPGARSTLAARELPDGEAYYRHLVRYFTTLDLTPEEVHETGLREVERIRAEMVAIQREVGFEGSFAAFLESLRGDPRFFAGSPRELLEKASYIAKRADGVLPSLFRTLPRLPYTVEPVPEHIAPKYTAGRYVQAAQGTGEPGKYWVNTQRLETRTLYTLTALTLHEAVPGHHLQVALAHEATEVPPFRRFDYVDAFGEGWGLYAEYLGVEAGLYETPYDRFGRLTYEMWRACRLVVDTGIHWYGWSRQQVLDYLAERTALSLHEISTETDRYISWPAQALAYKTGELEIKRLRRRAEEALGDRFDVRAFHDAVLGSGSVPLQVLELQIEDHIASQAASAETVR